MSSQQRDHARAGRAHGIPVPKSFQLSNEITGNGDTCAVGNASLASAGNNPDYSRSGFVWRDPKPPFKGAVE